MESIGDVLRKSPQAQHAMQAAERRIQQLLQHPLVHKLQQQHPEITLDVMRHSMNRVDQYVTEHESCNQCPGIDMCPNDVTGHYTILTTERLNEQVVQLVDRKVKCRKLVKQEQDQVLRSRIRSFYMDDQALLRGFSAEEMLQTDPERVRAVGAVSKYILATKEHGLSLKGLYLTGTLGTGKTYLMCYLLHELAKSGHTGVIVYMPEFIEELKSLMYEEGKVKELVELLKHTDLLVFDDIGAENLNPWARDHIIGAILNYRMNRKPTFYTSNYDLQTLEQHLSFTNREGEDVYKGQRLMERIRPFVDEVIVTGRNKRGIKK